MKKLYNTQLSLTSNLAKFFKFVSPNLSKPHLKLIPNIIFGMIMKAHPQFNLLAIGFPVKIAVAFAVLIVIIPAIIIHFKREFLNAIDALTILFQ